MTVTDDIYQLLTAALSLFGIALVTSIYLFKDAISEKISRGIRRPPVPKDCVLIRKEEYERLRRNNAILMSLVIAGVNNWSGYDYAWAVFEKDYPEYVE